MSLAAGSPLGPFRIEHRLGVGGMGEVYAATDTRLQRRVAIKVLHDGQVGDTSQRERLRREARAISALHHPHICTLYDVGVVDEIDYLVLELLEGETLQDRLRKGPLPLPDVLRIGSEIGSALAVAHRQGIVHRDLKPANVMLTRDGVKLLDFGLAKAVASSSVDAETPTKMEPATAAGLLAGTLPYMSPEQVQGHAVDARTDVFALGLVLYEMATGRRVFEGSNQASLIARILDHEPPALHTVVPVAPAALSHVVQGCLAKDPDDRWQSAHDVHRQLEWLRSTPLSATGVGTSRPGWTWWAPWAAAAIASILAATAWLTPRAISAPPARRLHFQVSLGNARLESLDAPELSPDGTRLAYTAVENGHRQLYVHDLETQVARPLPGTTDASFPFWSPDGDQVAFFARGALRRTSVSGGTSQWLAAAPAGSGGAWVGNTLLFAPSRSGSLQRLDAGAQNPAAVRGTIEGKVPSNVGFVVPSFFSDGDRYLTVSLGLGLERGLYLGELREGRLRRLMGLSSVWAKYAPGHVVYVQGRRLIARPLDAAAAKASGQERTIAESAGAFSTLPDGTIAYREADPPLQLTWVGRGGQDRATVGDPADYLGVTLAPQGGRAAVWRTDDNGNVDVWEVDTTTGIVSRLTSADAWDSDAAWSPDGRYLALTSARSGTNGVYVKDLDSGKEWPLHVGTAPMNVDGWTPDGKHVVARTSGRQVFMVPMTGDTRPRMVAETSYVQDETHVSPDGRWIAFNSNESGTYEIYVAAFPSFTSKRQVSKGGGVQPLWRGDGRELFYLAPDGTMMSVAIDGATRLTTAAPMRLFATNVEPTYQVPQYAVTADGQQFLLLDRGAPRPHVVHVLLNWLRPTP